MKTYKVDSVSKYLSLIEKVGISNYIYRGQNEPFCGIDAKGFRPYRGSFSEDKFYDIKQMKFEFYNEVISRLTDEEKKHFNAYCQHHGIPTNLLDFSYSPLVALFFACEGKVERTYRLSDILDTDISGNHVVSINLKHTLSDKSFSEFAEVYMISKHRLIDITSLLTEEDYDGFWTEVTLSEELREKLYLLFLKHFENNDEYIDAWIINIINCTIKNFKGILVDEFEGYNLNDVKKMLKKSDRDSLAVYGILYSIVMAIVEDENISYGEMYYMNEMQWGRSDKVSLAARIYLTMMLNLVDEASYMKDIFDFELDIYFTYSPPNLFDRINFQKGLFIYQPYRYEMEEVYNFGVLNKQRIVPDICIKIDKYMEVVEDLDSLGYNIGYIYADVDNIAKAILGRHNKLL